MRMSKREIWSRALGFVGTKIGRDRVDLLLAKIANSAAEYHSLSKVYERFCLSAENRAMVPNVIGWITDHPDMRDALSHFDLTMNRGWSEEDFYSRLTQMTERGRQADLTRRNNLWRQYAKSLHDITSFLIPFDSPNGSSESFFGYVGENCGSKEHAWSLAEEISHHIRGMGPPLVCDALKEIGVTNFAKPDTHIKYIFRRLGLCHGAGDREVFYSVCDFAENVNVMPSQVDKVFWLIGSGNFYMFRMAFGSLKAEFFDGLQRD